MVPEEMEVEPEPEIEGKELEPDRESAPELEMLAPERFWRALELEVEIEKLMEPELEIAPWMLVSEREIEASESETEIRVGFVEDESKRLMLEIDKVVLLSRMKPELPLRSTEVYSEPFLAPRREYVPAAEEPRSAETEYVPALGESNMPEKSTDLLSEPKPE